MTGKNKIGCIIKFINKEKNMDSSVLIAVVFISVVAVAISVSRKKKSN